MQTMKGPAAIIVAGVFVIAAATTPAAAHHQRLGGWRTVSSHAYAATWHHVAWRGHRWRAAAVRPADAYWGQSYGSAYASSEYGGFYPNVARRAWGGASSCTCGAW